MSQEWRDMCLYRSGARLRSAIRSTQRQARAGRLLHMQPGPAPRSGRGSEAHDRQRRSPQYCAKEYPFTQSEQVPPELKETIIAKGPVQSGA